MNRSPRSQRTVEPRSASAGPEVPPEPVHCLVEKHAREHPDRIALLFEEDAWTYAELNRRANQVAHRLRRRGIGPDDPVGVHIRRSLPLVASLLGTLKAGGAYVALPPTLPADRLRYMADDAGVEAVLVADSNGDSPFREIEPIDATAASLAREEETPPEVNLHDEHLAYILYTSGTTGRPKGVMQSHRALRHHAYVFGDEIAQITADRTFLFKSSYTFDLSISELFPPLTHGARVAVAPSEARGVRRLVQTIQAHGVTDVFVTPTRLRLLMDRDEFRDCRTVQHVYSAGEALSGNVRNEFLDQFDAALYNLYGTTEMCCGQTGLNCAEAAEARAVTSIGRPWSIYDAYVTDPDGAPTADGTPGELVLGGKGEARGYRGRPRETALRFVPDALSDHAGRRVYRTGDRARWTEEGRLEYLGREDDQLQIRGVRIETGEVEATLAEAEGIDLAAVRPLNERSGKADGLAAYVVPTDDKTPPPETLRDWGKTHLPDPAVPRSIRVLDEMPLLPSGKIDHSALPDPAPRTDRRKDRVPPQTETERRVASIWKEHLDVDRVGLHEHFFRIGGHSLLAVRIKHDIADQLGVEIPLETFLNAPTIAALAEAVEPQSEPQRAPIERHEYGDEAPLSASQRRMWLLQRMNPDSVAYNVPAVIQLNRHVDLDAFHRALTRLVERHEVLRTVFPERDESPVQKIRPAPDRVAWTVEDVTAAQDPEAEAQALIDRRIRTPFDLTEDPPLRLSMVKISDEEWLFCPLFHHIVIDEWTFGVLLDDLEALYEAERSQADEAKPLLPEAQRADEWHDAHEVLHQDLSPETTDDPTLNTTGWICSYDGEPYSEAEMRDWLQARIDRLSRLDLGRTLEIGAGTGMLLFRLAPQADEYVGLDFSKRALEYVDAVRKTLDRDLSNVSLVHGRADEIGGLDGSFDTILLNSVVQYFPDYSYLNAVLRAAAEKLRAPGTLYLGDVRDRRLAYAFHASVQRAKAPGERTRPALQERARTALEQDDELLVDPQSLARFAKGLPGLTGIDFTLPAAEYSTEMSAFRYGALLHARPDTAPSTPDTALSWPGEAMTLSALRNRLEEGEHSLLVTGIPNARVWEPLHFQHWLDHSSEASPVSTFDPPDGDEAHDPDALRRLGAETGYRVTVSPSTDPAGRTFDAIFEPRTDALSPTRPLTPLSATATATPAPSPTPPSSETLPPGPSLSLWNALTDRARSPSLPTQDRNAPGPSDLPIQYADYALWQQEQLQAPRYEEALQDWVDALEAVPERLDWPFDDFDRDREFGPAKSVELDVDGDVASMLNACADRQGTTMAVAFLAAFGLLLARYTGQHDMTVGMPVTNRDRPELDRLVGMLLNTLPFPVQVDEDLGFEAFLSRLGEKWRAAMARNWIPFEDIVDAVKADRPAEQLPLFDVMFTYVPAGRRSDQLGTLGAVKQDPIAFDLPEALCPLFFIVIEQDDGYRVRFRYDSHRFDAPTIRRMTEHFEQLLTSAVETPDRALRNLDLLSPEEKHRLSHGWAKGARIDVPDVPVHHLFEEKAERHPTRTAVVADDETWTYRTLNRRANRLAHRLRDDGVGPGTPVGVHIDRSASLIAALLGVLKAGGAYVALPPSLPDRRLQYMAQDAGVERTVVAGPTQTDLGGTHIDVETLQANRFPTHNPSVGIPRQELAYILYTSGTTGRPKGVMVSHAAVTDLVIVMKTHFPVGKNDAILLKTPYSFDVSVSEIFNPLVAGARLVTTPTGAEKNPQYLVDRIQDAEVSVLRMTPTELSSLLQADGADSCDSVRRVFAAGEALTPAVRDTFHDTWEKAELFNLWGPTEACVYGSWWPCRAENEGDEVPIGWPMSNASLYSLDGEMNLVPARVEGELFAAGPGLARGYRGRPRDTADAYRPNPYADERGARMYKTGDLVRWAEEGHLHFLGRKDDQIQLRGIRVELGEIEAHLESAPGVRHAAVRPFEGADGRIESLVAYVVTEGEHDLDAQALRTHLGEYLPTSLLPGRYVEISEMPRSPAGKIDRDGLPDPKEHVRTADDVQLQTGTERLIASIWRDVLDLETVTRHGNFFEFGGNSLAAVKIHRRLQRQFDKDIELIHLFEHTTIAQLADFLEASDEQAAPPSSPQQKRGRTRRERLKQQRRRRADRDDD